MNGRDRFLSSARLALPDYVPMFDLEINAESLIKLGVELSHDVPPIRDERDYSPEEQSWLVELLLWLAQRLDLDAVCVSRSVGIKRVPGEDDLGVDRLGIYYRLTRHGEAVPTHGPVGSLADIAQYKGFVPLDSDTEVLKFVRQRLPDRAVVFCLPDAFDLSWSLMGGMEKLLLQYVLQPDLCLALADICTTFIVSEVQMAAAAGADAIAIGGDLASRDTLLISPEHYRRYVKDYQAAIVAAAHKCGMPVIKHSDGNILPLMEDLIEVGFDCIHPIQPQSMDLAEVKERYGSRVCIAGNIDCTFLLPFGTVDQVRSAVKAAISAASQGGGYILSSSNSIHPDCAPANVIAMFEACRLYGSYGGSAGRNQALDRME